jgi:hypothetical protein
MKWQEQQQQGLQNSSLLWMLRDTIKERPDLKEDIDAFLEKLNKQDIKKIDSSFAAHRYPEKNLTYNRLTRYNGFTSDLTTGAQSVLFLLMQCSSQDNLVAVPVSIICTCCSITDKTCRNALKELINKGVIALYRRSARHTPNVYMLNWNLIASGKQPSLNDKKEFYDMGGVDATVNKSDYVLAYVTIKDSNGRYRSYGTLQEHEESLNADGNNNEANR